MSVRLVALNDIPSRSEGTGESEFDALVVVFGVWPTLLPEPVLACVERYAAVDRGFRERVSLIACPDAPGGRLIMTPIRSEAPDVDDVRGVADAARAGVARAIEAGAQRPAIAFRGMPRRSGWHRALEVGLLGALDALWEPMEASESLGDRFPSPVEVVGFLAPSGGRRDDVAPWVLAAHHGRALARHLTAGNPERLTPLRFAELCRQRWAGGRLEVEVIDDLDVLRADYPLLYAVGRASLPVERHRPCVLRVVYEPEGPVQQTVLLAGKGVTYDTGGADLKVGGNMAGMSRDKGGAAAVAGVLEAVGRRAPPGLRVVAEIGLVRNSVGADGFVTDEILVSHAGQRVRVGNTDAEGRLVLADLLSHLREEALASVDPVLLSVATLTGHAALALGPYTSLVENGPARSSGLGADLAATAETWGEPMEVLRLRREDYQMVRGRDRSEDLLSCNNRPSSQTPRGHQFPVAFLIQASGLSQQGDPSPSSLPFAHLDIAGSAVTGPDWTSTPPQGIGSIERTSP